MILTAAELLVIAERILGQSLVVRDMGLLESAAGRPTVMVFGEDAYPGPYMKAAALLRSIVNNHALLDGNKRLGWVAARTLLLASGVDTPLTEDERYDLTMAVARHELDDVSKIAAVLRGDHLVMGPANLAHLAESVAQADRGETVEMDLGSL